MRVGLVGWRGMVGSMLVAMYLPMFKMANVVGG